MPSIKDKSTVEAIAREFCSNGRNKEKAMRTIGYAESSCKSGKAVKDVYGNLRVKAEIGRLDGKTAKREEVTRQYCIDKLQEIAENSLVERNKLTAISLLGDFTGDKRALAPNPLAMAGIRARMSAEEELSRLAHAKERTKALSESKPAFPRINKGIA